MWWPMTYDLYICTRNDWLYMRVDRHDWYRIAWTMGRICMSLYQGEHKLTEVWFPRMLTKGLLWRSIFKHCRTFIKTFDYPYLDKKSKFFGHIEDCSGNREDREFNVNKRTNYLMVEQSGTEDDQWSVLSRTPWTCVCGGVWLPASPSITL